MPIRPELKHHYEGEAWERTRRLILRRAQNKCECIGECGQHRDYRCAREDRSDYRKPNGILARVILTVAHLNQTAGDDRPENLRAFCQACHLRYDTKQHVRNTKTTLRAQKNNLELFE